MLYRKEREAVVAAGRAMCTAGLAVGTWGNISCRLPRENLLAITPSGMDYYSIAAEDIVIMDVKGNVVDGRRKPSTEHPLHRAIYAARPDVGAVVHTHSVYATAMAAARVDIPGIVEDLVQIVGGPVRVARYALPGTEELGRNAVEALQGRNGVLLANHGAVGAAATLGQALTVCQVIEKSARITIAARVLGGAVELPQEDIDVMRQYFLNHYGQR